MDALEDGGVPRPLIEQDEGVFDAIFYVEDHQLQRDDFAGNCGNVVEEPLGCAALIQDLHACAGEVGDACGAQIAAHRGANVEEAVVHADRVAGHDRAVDGDVLIDGQRLLIGISRIRYPRALVETEEEVVVTRALVLVFGREKPERIREGFRVCRRANAET